MCQNTWRFTGLQTVIRCSKTINQHEGSVPVLLLKEPLHFPAAHISSWYCCCASLVQHNLITWYPSLCVFLLVFSFDSLRNFPFRPQLLAVPLQCIDAGKELVGFELENIQPRCWRCICCPVLSVRNRQNSPWTFEGWGERSSPMRGTWSFPPCGSSGAVQGQLWGLGAQSPSLWARPPWSTWLRLCLSEVFYFNPPGTDTSVFAQQPGCPCSHRDISSSRRPSHHKVFV